MTNDIQLAFNSPQVPAPWQGGGGGLGMPAASAAGGEASPFQKVHRLLRGRYLLAVVLGFVGAAAGAAGGFLSQKPSYSSVGLIEIDPRIPIGKAEVADKVMAMAQSYVNSQAAKIKSESVIRAALRDPKFKAVRPYVKSDDTSTVKVFNDNLDVKIPLKSTNFIQITYSDNAKDAQKIAPIAVQAVLQSYQDLYAGEDAKGLQRRIDYWIGEQNKLDNSIQTKQHLIESLAKAHEDDPMVIRAHSEDLIVISRELQKNEEMLAQAEADLKAGVAQAASTKLTFEDWARVDETMARYVQIRNETQLRLNSMEAQLGPNHPAVTRGKEDLAARENAMKQHAEQLAAKYLIRWKADGTGGLLIPKDLTALRESVVRARALVDRESKKISEMREVAAKVNTLKDEISQAKLKLIEAGDQLREYNFQKEFLGPGRIRVIDTGTIAQIDKDRRPMFAAAGFLGGAAIPIGLLMLIGLLDSRYRYSDEASAGQGVGGLTLLGILPNLPDRLSDPEQAAIAAHCVHQIRTMLQINAGMEDRRVFAVTSASPGDGKTSLTLALGLSYAACGTRTLLIDCDLIGAGLSSRMNVSAAEGVLEAIANRNLLQYVRQTDVADVALLPVGSAGNLHASTLSPAALRRLIEEAEKHFETILIDTGPILGSIEASLVCAAADATILTVARGQQRPMVEKSLSHLGAIGARLAGVVFNRAQSSDFERSISGVSMRSVGIHGPRGSAENTGNRFGPMTIRPNS